MNVQALAPEVDEAAECFSWGPSVLRKWIAARPQLDAFESALLRLADGSLDAALKIIESSELSGSEKSLASEAVRLVACGTTPNQTRARLLNALQLGQARDSIAA
jgi:hypothetical protein